MSNRILTDNQALNKILCELSSLNSSSPSLQDVIDRLDQIIADNQTLNQNVLNLQAVNESIRDFVDEIESNQVIQQTSLDNILTAINNTSADQITELQNIISFVDGLEAGQVATQAQLTTITGFVDDLETLITTLTEEVDQVEELLTELRDLPNTQVPASYYWDNNGTLEEVLAYVKLDQNQDFLEWVVLNGTPPPNLLDPSALSLSKEKDIEFIKLCTTSIIESTVVSELQSDNSFNITITAQYKDGTPIQDGDSFRLSFYQSTGEYCDLVYTLPTTILSPNSVSNCSQDIINNLTDATLDGTTLQSGVTINFQKEQWAISLDKLNEDSVKLEVIPYFNNQLGTKDHLEVIYKSATHSNPRGVEVLPYDSTKLLVLNSFFSGNGAIQLYDVANLDFPVVTLLNDELPELAWQVKVDPQNYDLYVTSLPFGNDNTKIFRYEYLAQNTWDWTNPQEITFATKVDGDSYVLINPHPTERRNGFPVFLITHGGFDTATVTEGHFPGVLYFDGTDWQIVSSRDKFVSDIGAFEVYEGSTPLSNGDNPFGNFYNNPMWYDNALYTFIYTNVGHKLIRGVWNGSDILDINNWTWEVLLRPPGTGVANQDGATVNGIDGVARVVRNFDYSLYKITNGEPHFITDNAPVENGTQTSGLSEIFFNGTDWQFRTINQTLNGRSLSTQVDGLVSEWTTNWALDIEGVNGETTPSNEFYGLDLFNNSVYLYNHLTGEKKTLTNFDGIQGLDNSFRF